MPHQPIFTASLETQTLIKKLSTLNPGDFISYADLDAAIKGDVRREHYYALATAQKNLLRDAQMVFAPVRGEGIRRLTPEEISDKTPLVIARVRNAARRHGRELATVNTSGFSQEQSKKHADAMLQVALIGTAVSRSVQAKVHELSNPASTAADRDTILRIYGG